MRGLVTGVGSHTDIGAPPLTHLSFMRDTTWPSKSNAGCGHGGLPRTRPRKGMTIPSFPPETAVPDGKTDRSYQSYLI